jgi:nicotinamide-nucleotide amidase
MAEALDPAVPVAVDELAKFVLREASDRRLKLATAESCTGGLLASLLTDIPGLSHTFERGFVTYTDEAKHQMLGVSIEILQTDTAVSERSACAMAEGALAHSSADLAAAVTGYTEGPPDDPSLAGLVHFAVARRNRPTRRLCKRFGDVGRAEVRIRALETALGMLRDQMIQAADAA